MLPQAPGAATLRNQSLTVNLQSENAAFSVQAAGLDAPVFAARVGAEVNHRWLWSTDYPTRHVAVSAAQDIARAVAQGRGGFIRRDREA